MGRQTEVGKRGGDIGQHPGAIVEMRQIDEGGCAFILYWAQVFLQWAAFRGRELFQLPKGGGGHAYCCIAVQRGLRSKKANWSHGHPEFRKQGANGSRGGGGGRATPLARPGGEGHGLGDRLGDPLLLLVLLLEVLGHGGHARDEARLAHPRQLRHPRGSLGPHRLAVLG